MAYAVLKYDLSSVEDRMEYRRAVASLDMACFIFEVLSNGKRRCEGKSIDEIWEYLWQMAESHNIKIDQITQ